MSSLIAIIESKQVLVATDTLATSPTGDPIRFTTKAFFIPHLNTIIAGTGAGGMLDRWFNHINTRMVVRGIDHLNHHAPRTLPNIWERYKQDFTVSDESTTTLYHFGFSEVTAVIHAYAYRSADGFESEAISYGSISKPPFDLPDTFRVPDDLKSMMEQQRRIQLEQPRGQKVYIGGEINVCHLTETGVHIYTSARFDDFGEVEAKIYSRFEINKKLAPCH